MNSFESVPTSWDDARDERFFRIVCHLLTPQLVAAGTSLLAANDPELLSAA